jgi:peptide/nickel transport system permease protein
MMYGIQMAIRRLLLGLLIVMAVSCLLFYVNEQMGDPINALLPPDATDAEKQQLRASLNLDHPVWERFGSYVWSTLLGDFGRSYRFSEAVGTIIAPYLWGTIKLIALALPIGIIGGIILGLLSQSIPRRYDWALNKTLLLLHALPGFVPCILAIEIFSVRLKWLAPSGSEGWRALVMPVALLAGAEAIKIAIVMRSKLAEIVKEPYLLTAKAKGLGTVRIQTHYLLRSGLAIMFSFVSIQIGVLLSSTVVVESIFSYPGIGNLAIQALSSRDLPLIQACIVFTTLLFLCSRFAMDLLYPIIDPRIRQTMLEGKI